MTFTTTLPTEPGLYRHRWDFKGEMREQTLFVGYTNASAPKLQGTEPNAYMPRKLRCCRPEEHLHADRLTPAEWGGWWERAAQETRTVPTVTTIEKCDNCGVLVNDPRHICKQV